LRTLILVRHGETAWNAEKRWQGQTDIPLSDIGRAQAKLLAPRLAKLGTPSRILTSDLSRARETAEIVARHNGFSAPIECDVRLRERFFGSWEGKTSAEIGVLNATPGSGERPADGETYDAVWARLLCVITELGPPPAEDRSETILIVGHGGSLRAILSWAVGLGAEGIGHFQLANTALSIVTQNGEKRRLVRANDAAHLEKNNQ
jgi:broad specificity phosphatase PhoE